MKKAKIFLTGLAVLAVVGGALAFKAKTPRWFASVCDTSVTPHICTINSFQSFATTLNGTIAADFEAYGKPCNAQNLCKTKTIADQ